MLSARLSDLAKHGGKLATEQAILRSLKFTRWRDRHSNIVELHAWTFDWIFDKKADGASSSAKINFNQIGSVTRTGYVGSQGKLVQTNLLS